MDLELNLKRTFKGAEATIGELSINGEFSMYILEDPVRPAKIAGRTAIPAGRYQIVLTMSPRFKRILPLLLNVPNYEGIRIHIGNTAADTEGCLLPGLARVSDTAIGSSAKAFAKLFAILEDANKQGRKMWITIG